MAANLVPSTLGCAFHSKKTSCGPPPAWKKRIPASILPYCVPCGHKGVCHPHRSVVGRVPAVMRTARVRSEEREQAINTERQHDAPPPTLRQQFLQWQTTINNAKAAVPSMGKRQSTMQTTNAFLHDYRTRYR